MLRLVLNRHESSVAARLADLSPGARRTLDSIPFTESLRLAEAAGGRARLAILRTIHHTGPQPFWPSLRASVEDAWSLVRLADSLLRVDDRRQRELSATVSDPIQAGALVSCATDDA